MGIQLAALHLDAKLLEKLSFVSGFKANL